jgi:hypothetical protein
VTSRPLLVYSHIDRIKRLTRVMLLAFAVAMLASVTAATVFIEPFADAALLSRDPAGLAAAPIRIGKFRGERLSVGEGSVQRIQLLARMAQGDAR